MHHSTADGSSAGPPGVKFGPKSRAPTATSGVEPDVLSPPVGDDCSTARLVVHSERERRHRPGERKWRIVLARLHRDWPTATAPLDIHVHDRNGNEIAYLADAGTLVDMRLEPGIYTVTLECLGKQCLHTMVLQPGTVFDLELALTGAR